MTQKTELRPLRAFQCSTKTDGTTIRVPAEGTKEFNNRCCASSSMSAATREFGLAFALEKYFRADLICDCRNSETSSLNAFNKLAALLLLSLSFGAYRVITFLQCNRQKTTTRRVRTWGSQHVLFKHSEALTSRQSQTPRNRHRTRCQRSLS